MTRMLASTHLTFHCGTNRNAKPAAVRLGQSSRTPRAFAHKQMPIAATTAKPFARSGAGESSVRKHPTMQNAITHFIQKCLIGPLGGRPILPGSIWNMPFNCPPV